MKSLSIAALSLFLITSPVRLRGMDHEERAQQIRQMNEELEKAAAQAQWPKESLKFTLTGKNILNPNFPRLTITNELETPVRISYYGMPPVSVPCPGHEVPMLFPGHCMLDPQSTYPIENSVTHYDTLAKEWELYKTFVGHMLILFGKKNSPEKLEQRVIEASGKWRVILKEDQLVLEKQV